MTARFQSRWLMSISNRVPDAACQGKQTSTAELSSPTAFKPVFALAAGQREFRLDLFRGLALWLIYISTMFRRTS